MTQEFEVTAEELVRVLQRRGIPLPSEIGAFLVLEACEKLSGRPAQLSTRDIFITEQGDVECADRTRLDSEADAASALLGVLAELLVCAAPGVPNMLLDLVEHGPNEHGLTLGLLRSDLEACLLPLNRAATRRVLSRLVREVRKSAAAPSVRSGTAPAGTEGGDVDAAFDDLLGDSVPPPQAASQARAARERLRERAARERELHEAAEAAVPSERAVDRNRPTPLPRTGSRAARRRASESAAADSELSRARRQPAEPQPDSRYRAARESAFRGHSSQAPADGSPRPEEHTAYESPSAADDLAGEPLARRGRAADGGERARRRAPTDDAELAPRGRRRRRLESEADEGSRRSELEAERGRYAADGGERRRRSEIEDERARYAADSGESERPRRGLDAGSSRRPDPRASGSLRGSVNAGLSEHPRSKSSHASLDPESMLEVQSARGRVGLWVFIASTAAAVALLLGYFALGREQTQSALGFLKPSEPAERAPVKPSAPRREYGDLRVNSKPDRAQVLLLIGPGPALATDIPVGVAQEFVAIAEGYRPARALLPADATWDELDGQPRYELAIQARPLAEGAANRGRATDGLGATLLPQEVGTPRGRLGSVRVVTTPRAAHVYQLIGFTPDVHVDNLPLDHPYEILVYLEGKGGVQKHIEPSDFHLENGKRVAKLDVQLSN